MQYITKKAVIRLPSRAENEARTRDPNLGKVVLYQLSYFRVFCVDIPFSRLLAKVGNLFFLRQGCTLPTELFPRFGIFFFGEEDETRTHTTQRSLPPQSSASTNSATSPFPKNRAAPVPRTGLEPARLSTLAPETSASTIPPPGHLLNTSILRCLIERKTRLELATPTLARLCSTN